MTLGGLLKHLAYVEDWWVNQVFADNPAPEPWASVDWKADGDWEWHSRRRTTPPTSSGRCTTRRSPPPTGSSTRRSPIPSALESLSRRTFRSDPTRRHNLRWILVHLIEEYARHNGHADLIRESIDGSGRRRAGSPPTASRRRSS